MWGAKSGVEQLPPFPEPSHFAAFQGGVPQSARSCIVSFKDEASRDNARPMVRASVQHCSCMADPGRMMPNDIEAARQPRPAKCCMSNLGCSVCLEFIISERP